jgi:NAD(P)-dependent dehydrogenase (short-subunit alcohol dehydrogenase family)
VVSAGFKLWKLDPFQDLQSTQRYVSGDAYAHTKLLNVLFSLALAKRLAADQVTVNLVHPGMSWTQMTKSMTPRRSRRSGWSGPGSMPDPPDYRIRAAPGAAPLLLRSGPPKAEGRWSRLGRDDRPFRCWMGVLN